MNRYGYRRVDEMLTASQAKVGGDVGGAGGACRSSAKSAAW